MNTVHFALQAGLSKVVLFFQSKGADSAVVQMGWKDYFMRGAVRITLLNRFHRGFEFACFFKGS
jgi:hypothetical protein